MSRWPNTPSTRDIYCDQQTILSLSRSSVAHPTQQGCSGLKLTHHHQQPYLIFPTLGCTKVNVSTTLSSTHNTKYDHWCSKPTAKLTSTRQASSLTYSQVTPKLHKSRLRQISLVRSRLVFMRKELSHSWTKQVESHWSPTWMRTSTHWCSNPQDCSKVENKTTLSGNLVIWSPWAQYYRTLFRLRLWGSFRLSLSTKLFISVHPSNLRFR